LAPCNFISSNFEKLFKGLMFYNYDTSEESLL